jgi:simple sugar transport system permease protein
VVGPAQRCGGVVTDPVPFFEAAVRTAAPLLLAAVGESVAERAGVINIGLEGCIVAGAYAAFVFGAASPVAGYAGALVAGLGVGALFALFAIVRRHDQVIVGTALTMLSLGATGTLFRSRPDHGSVFVAMEPVVRVPFLADVPVLGAVFSQPITTYVALALLPAVWWWLYRTNAGIALRALGDSHEAARAAGVRVVLVQSGALLFGSALGGLAGGALVLAQAGSFAEGMSSGRGFLAIAIVALGRWRVGGVAAASVVFGAAMALQYVVQSLGWGLRYELVLMIPYLATLAALGLFGRGTAPAMLGRRLAD